MWWSVWIICSICTSIYIYLTISCCLGQLMIQWLSIDCVYILICLFDLKLQLKVAGLASQAYPRLSEHLQTTLFPLGWWCNGHAPEVWKPIRFSLLVEVIGKSAVSAQVNICLTNLVVQVSWWFNDFLSFMCKCHINLKYNSNSRWLFLHLDRLTLPWQSVRHTRSSIGLAMQTLTNPRTGQRWLNSWLVRTILVTLFAIKWRWVQRPNRERYLWCTTCLTTGRASLLSPRLASTTWWFSPWPIASALQECIWRESLNWSIVQVTCYKYGCWHKLHILTHPIRLKVDE